MKKQLLAAAVLSALAGAASAQSSVTVYGAFDASVAKQTDKTLAIIKRDANKLGFKGSEDLGGGLSALFQLEMRFEPDTGTLESTTRPAFQGQTRVGLQGSFGMIRIGRGVTALQDAKDAFDPFNGISGTPGFKGDVEVAGWNSQPLDPAGSSSDRFNNAVWWNSPVFLSGFQANLTVGTKEANGGPAVTGRGTAAAPQYPAGADATITPYSAALTYKAGPVGAMAGYERNAIESTLWFAGASVMATPDLKLMATYARQSQDHTKLTNPRTTGWLIGANYTVGAGKVLLGFGEKKPDGATMTKQWSIGYEYSLSKRTFLYADASDKKTAADAKYYGIGIHHNF